MWRDDLALGLLVIKPPRVKRATTDAGGIDYHTSINSAVFKFGRSHSDTCSRAHQKISYFKLYPAFCLTHQQSNGFCCCCDVQKQYLSAPALFSIRTWPKAL